ncbi:hypothetical protein [Oceanirhabdus sp. W0125-5]|uniref:hypothetical protein n=1 Tax=Oceanirhabdus sp. W0125-5 TaxID=2999116 RepID=UPI0022F34624|nr:hypothetical protein [Oceanirhabdus sp. W0125-5]WBW97036.1 hypothetical protein OW730_25595 [Oceanirhabdus sp. W0125-5]
MLRKKIFVAFSLSALLGISYLGLNNLLSVNENVAATIGVNDLSTTSLNEKTENGNNNYLNENDNNKIYKKISTEVDFAKAYDDFDSLLKDSSLVVSGKVKDLKSYITDFDAIYTAFELNIKDVFKGTVDEKKISIYTQGGSIPYGEYFASNEELFKIKLSEEAFNQAKEDSINKADELVISTFANTENIEKNDSLLLFLNFDETENKYYIVGSIHYGKFFYDEENEEFYRLNHEEKIGNKSKKLKIKVNAFKNKVKNKI